MRRVSAVAVLAMVLFGAPAALALTPQSDLTDSDRFVELVNEARLDRGLPPLVSNPGLAAHAADHSGEMISAEQVFHTGRAELAGVATGWELIGEDVGAAPNVRTLVSALLETPERSGNIFGDYDTVGVSAVQSTEGTVWITAIYLRSGADTVITGLEDGFAWTRFASFIAARESGGPPTTAAGCADGLACID
jgi:uncharacterized protein YkwD